MIRRPPRSTRTEHTLSLHDALPISGIEAVHPHHAGAQRLGGAVRLLDVAGPHRRGEAVDRVVADLHGFLGIAEGDRRKHRAEDLLLRAGHVVLYAVTTGRLVRTRVV